MRIKRSFINDKAIGKDLPIALLVPKPEVFLTAIVFLATAYLSIDNFVEATLLSKSYALVAGALLCWFFVIITSKYIIPRLNRLDLSVLIFTGYLILRMSLSSSSGINILTAISFLLLFFFFKIIGTDNAKYINYVIVLICTSLAVYGLMQYLGVFYTGGFFRITGTFDNPAGFAACLAAGFPFCIASLKQSKRLKWLAICSTITIAAAIILSGSRAGMIAISITGLVILTNRFRQFLKRNKYILAIAILFFVAVCAGLFFLKKDSALGRLLIWKTSWDMIADKPILGHGPGAFQAEYMSYQANYFSENPDSEYALLGDKVTHPFNEYLLLTIEYGVIGLALLSGLFIVLTKTVPAISPYLLSLISIAIFSCFSYPLRYAFIILLSAYCLSQVGCRRAIMVQTGLWGRMALLIIISVLSVQLIADIRFESRWGNLVRSCSLGKTRETMPDYADLYRTWNRNPLFLYNYGATLNRAGDYTTSIVIMNQCRSYFNDYDVQMIIGDNHFKLQAYQEALDSYTEASLMCPNRFMPLYKKFQIYTQCGMGDEAYRLAQEIIHKPIKVHSGSVNRIIREMHTFIDNKRINE